MDLATIGIKADYRDITKAGQSLDTLGRKGEIAERKIDRSSKGISKSFISARGAIGIFTAAVAGIAVAGTISAIRGIADFESSMKSLQAVTRASAEQMSELEKQARSLGATTIFSAKQTADAQTFLARAGFSVNEVIAATPEILDLAIAGTLDLGRAADIASNVLGGMALDVSELSRVTDVMAETAASSNTNIEQLGSALSFVAPLAEGAGISIEETAAAIGVLSDSGLQGTRAGTGLLGVIRQLSNVTPQAEAALGKYGLSVSDVNIETHGLTKVIDRLRAANIGTADSFKIFGSEAKPAANILANGAEKVRLLTGQLNDSDGAAKKMADTMSEGLTPSLQGFQSALSELGLELGDQGLKNGAVGLVVTLTTVVRDLSSAIDAAGDEAKDTSDWGVLEDVLKGVALSARALFEMVDSAASSLVFIGTIAERIAKGQFSKLGDAWDDYSAKIAKNIKQTDLFRRALFGLQSAEGDRLDYVRERIALLQSQLNDPSFATGGSNLVAKKNELLALVKELREGVDEELSNNFDFSEIVTGKPRSGKIKSDAEPKKAIDSSSFQIDFALDQRFEKEAEIDAMLRDLYSSRDEDEQTRHEAKMQRSFEMEAREWDAAAASIAASEKVQENKKQAALGGLNFASGIAGQLASMQNEQSKEGFESSKKLRMAEVGMGIPQSAQSAYTSVVGTPFIGPALAPIAAGAAVVFGMAQMAKINAQQFEPQKVTAFAKGGIVDSPTFFNSPTSGVSVMGEAGAEAIMPVKRGANGELGVQAVGGGKETNLNFNITTPDGDSLKGWLMNNKSWMINYMRSASVA